MLKLKKKDLILTMIIMIITIAMTITLVSYVKAKDDERIYNKCIEIFTHRFGKIKPNEKVFCYVNDGIIHIQSMNRTEESENTVYPQLVGVQYYSERESAYIKLRKNDLTLVSEGSVDKETSGMLLSYNDIERIAMSIIHGYDKGYISHRTNTDIADRDQYVEVIFSELFADPREMAVCDSGKFILIRKSDGMIMEIGEK